MGALLGLLFLLIPSAVSAQQGDRPYLELPYAGDEAYPVTCGYDCYQHKGTMSNAVDFAIPSGVPILAAASGRVMAVTWEVGLPRSLDLGDALILYIDHGSGWFTRYVHLDGVTVETDDLVQMGDVIGYSGKTGAAGAHLHFELKYGTALHSPSVPIDELFDGAPPEIGSRYLSNNHTLAGTLPLLSELSPPLFEDPTATPLPARVPSVTPTETVEPATPTPAPALVEPTAEVTLAAPSRFPLIVTPARVSANLIEVGESVVVSFTLRNTTAEPLQIALLGVSGRRPGEPRPDADALIYDRTIILNPNRSYRFEQEYTFERAGRYALSPFLITQEREWLPLDGETVPVAVEVLPSHRYLPLVTLPDASDRLPPGER